MNEGFPAYDEWVEYCFTQGYKDFSCHHDGEDADFARQARFDSIPYNTLAEHAIRLFSDPAFVADRYSDKQIGHAVWYLFGSTTCLFTEIALGNVEAKKQIRVFESVGTVYTELFDRVCNLRGSKPDDNMYNGGLNIDGGVYMLWDMDSGLASPTYSPEKHPHLVEPCFRVLETALMRCRTSTCKISALHGLGHAQQDHKNRVPEIIDRFLQLPGQPEFVREYAGRAREGCVQ